MVYFRRSQKGFAILIVLVAVAIMMLLYFVQINTFFGPGLPSTPAGIEQHPWVLENLLVEENEDIKLPRSPKLQLDEPFSVSAPVRREKTDRGIVTLSFEMNGRITAQWKCTYLQTGQEYQIDANMRGNISVKRTFQDEQGKNKSRLFLIAEGPYTKTPLGNETAFGTEKGMCWLTGWIDPDRRIEGHVTITTEEEWAAAYSFASP